MTTRWRNLSRHSRETAVAREKVWQPWYKREGRGREEVWERFLSRWFYQDCAWWQSSLSCWLVEAGHTLLHDIKADPRVGIPIGEEAGRSKGSPSFPRYRFNNRVRSFVHVQDETSRRLRNDRQ